mgnify:CR=1 FL=1
MSISRWQVRLQCGAQSPADDAGRHALVRGRTVFFDCRGQSQKGFEIAFEFRGSVE